MTLVNDLSHFQATLNTAGIPTGPVDGLLGGRTIAGTRRFQEAWAGGPAGEARSLKVDGIPGPQTMRAAIGLPYLSPHFQTHEFGCRHCGVVVVARELVRGLEALRRVAGKRPLRIVSGYRCPPHNSRVGGAARSQHQYGTAADLDYPCSTRVAQDLGVFSGIGQKGGKVRHLDVRHTRPDTNPTRNVSGTRPALWNY